jgi:uncharacterized protein involved in exopolysaccharide biosynthesis
MHFINVLIRRRWTLLWYSVAVTAVVVLVSFLFPNQYKSTVVVLPPESGFQSAELTMSDLGMFAGAGLALPMMATPSDILEAVITSRTVRDSLVSRLDLKRKWNSPKAAKRLGDRSGATVKESGIITVWAIEIVNTKARRSREFVEGRLAETRAELDRASAELERFQNEHKTIALDAQIEALIRNAAELKAQITADDIELSVLQGSLSPEHPAVRSLKSRIRETQRRLDMLQTSPSNDTTTGLFDTGLESVPRLVQELAVIMRRLTVTENLFALLTERYETARIEEQRDTPSFSVLDHAADGGIKVRPMRTLIGLATFLTSFGLAVAMILVRAYLQELPSQDPARHRALQEIRASFRSKTRRDPRSGNPT